MELKWSCKVLLKRKIIVTEIILKLKKKTLKLKINENENKDFKLKMKDVKLKKMFKTIFQIQCF